MINKKIELVETKSLPKILMVMLGFYLTFILAFCAAAFIFPPEVCPNLSLLLMAGISFYGFQHFGYDDYFFF